MRRRDLLGLICGAPAWWPLLAKAQQSVKVHRIAVVHPVAPPEYIDAAKSTHLWAPFFEGLRQLGFVEGENITIERYSGAGQADRFSELVERVVATHPDVIFSVSGRLARQFKAATQTIPIVMVVPDPIALGLVSNLAHPGGNITGVTLDAGNEFYAKHLELIRRISPTASKIAYLMPRAGWEHPDLYMPIKKAAIQIGVSLIPALIEPPADEGQFRRLLQ